VSAEKVVGEAHLRNGQAAGDVKQPGSGRDTEPAANGAQAIAPHRLRKGIAKNIGQERAGSVDAGILQIRLDARDDRLELKIIAGLAAADETNRADVARTAVVDLARGIGSELVARPR
jgi:hypothetical protein